MEVLSNTVSSKQLSSMLKKSSSSPVDSAKFSVLDFLDNGGDGTVSEVCYIACN